jgi:multicomponent Na+:H+ antiporter subunit E
MRNPVHNPGSRWQSTTTMKHTISLGLLLGILWWVLSGYAKPLLLAFGAFSVLFTLWLARRMDAIDHESHPIHMSLGLMRFWVRLIVEIVVSNLQVLGAILSPRPNAIQPHFLRVRVRQTSDLGKVILANAITLTPGTVSVALIGDELLVHALTRASGQAVRDGQLDLLVPSDVEEVQP